MQATFLREWEEGEIEFRTEVDILSNNMDIMDESNVATLPKLL